MAVILPQLIIAVALLLLSRFFIRTPKDAKKQESDDQPSTLATRGTMIPYVVGTYELGYVFAWADDQGRFSRTVSSGGGKGFGGGGGGGSNTTWYSDAWHILNIGIGSSLTHIRENGKIVWEGPINRETTPSGSVIDAGDVGTFMIYWGELDQPLCQPLADKLGVRSTWPGYMFIYWIEKKLGSSPYWPEMRYKRSCEYDCVPSLGGDYMIDNGTSRGVNAAHFLAQILTGDSPWGIGHDANKVDRNGLLRVSDLVLLEHLPINFCIEDGDTVEQILEGILTDIGVMMVDHEERLTFIAVRPSASLPVFDEDVVVAPDPEGDISLMPGPSRTIFSLSDEDLNYRDNPINVDDDGQADVVRSYSTVNIKVASITNLAVAESIVPRRAAETMSDNAVFTVSGIHGSTHILPGQGFTLPAFGPMIVRGVQRNTFSATTQIRCGLDSYSIESGSLRNSYVTPPPATVVIDPAYDQFITFFELPPEASTDITIVVLRIRAHKYMSGANIWVSTNGSSYQQIGQQNSACCGGILQEDILADGDDIIDDGPIFEDVSPDIALVQDLSGNDPAWQGGQQICAIGREVFYLRRIHAIAESDWAPATAYAAGQSRIPTSLVLGFRYVCVQAGVSGPVEPTWPTVRGEQVNDGSVIWEARGFNYALKGLIRARMGTAMLSHEPSEKVFICPSTLLRPFVNPIFLPGERLCVKSQPFSLSGPLALSAATVSCQTLSGAATGENFLLAQLGDTETDLLISFNGDRMIATP